MIRRHASARQRPLRRQWLSLQSCTFEPEQAKALLRILIAELRVNGRHNIQPTYRVITPDHAATAGVCATSGKVETVGIEPTSAVA